MATLQAQQPASASPRSCDAHRERAGVSVPATHFIGSQAFCDRCFRGNPIPTQERRLIHLPAVRRPSPASLDARHSPCSRQKPPRRGDPLSPRERQVVELVAEGRSNKEIGLALHISKRTATFHASNALAKSGAATRAELAAWFREADGALFRETSVATDASVLVCLKRAESSLQRARAALSRSAGDALRRLDATSQAQERLAKLELAFAAMAEFAQACGPASDLDRLQDPGRPAPHLGGHETLQRSRDLER